jgi:predicted molibdopterin-dependent oxidoreductase YjgC
LFRRIESGGAIVRFRFEGDIIAAREGDTVAAALLASGVAVFRETPVTGAARAPWCMMGVCFDCLVEIDGRASQQACMVRVAEGMRVRRQRGAAAIFSTEPE